MVMRIASDLFCRRPSFGDNGWFHDIHDIHEESRQSQCLRRFRAIFMKVLFCAEREWMGKVGRIAQSHGAIGPGDFPRPWEAAPGASLVEFSGRSTQSH